MSIRCKPVFGDSVPKGRDEFRAKQRWNLYQFAPNDHPTRDTLLELLAGLKSPIRAYHQHRHLEIFSHTNYNTASAEIIGQIVH